MWYSPRLNSFELWNRCGFCIFTNIWQNYFPPWIFPYSFWTRVKVLQRNSLWQGVPHCSKLHEELPLFGLAFAGSYQLCLLPLSFCVGTEWAAKPYLPSQVNSGFFSPFISPGLSFFLALRFLAGDLSRDSHSFLCPEQSRVKSFSVTIF